ncbi:hypothetical protein C8J56DRAFT_928944, partial [Mycena floridula]
LFTVRYLLSATLAYLLVQTVGATPLESRTVYRCGIDGQVSPPGYMCCAIRSPPGVNLGGTCFEGTTGVCPL